MNDIIEMPFLQKNIGNYSCYAKPKKGSRFIDTTEKLFMPFQPYKKGIGVRPTQLTNRTLK